MSILSNVDQNSLTNLQLYLIAFATFFYLISILPSGKYAKIIRENQENWQIYKSKLQEIQTNCIGCYNFQLSLTYEEIDDFFIERLKLRKTEIEMEMFAKNPELYRRYKDLFENISPWKKLHSDPNKTILPYVHVPKTAGSTFRAFLQRNSGRWQRGLPRKQRGLPGSLSKWPYSNQLFPDFDTNSFNSPGCRPFPWGGTHCGFAELDSCLKNDYANLLPKYQKTQATENYFRTWPRPRPRPANLNNTLISKYKDNIKYLSIIRNPLKRVVSEYYYWKPKNESRIIKHEGCGHPSWSPGLCWDSKSIKNWTESIYNSAHNRQLKSFYPMNTQFTCKNTKKCKKSKTYPIYPENLTFDKEIKMKDGECSNLNGRKDYKFITHGNYAGSNSVASLNTNFEALIKTIENVEENFSFIAIMEEMDLSVKLAKVVLNFKNSNGITRSKERIKRNAMHSSEQKRPKEPFEIGLLMDIFERNLLDMLLWDYLNQKFQISLEYYTKEEK